MVDIKQRLKTIIKLIDEKIELINKQFDEAEDIALIPDTTLGERWGLSYAKGLVLGTIRVIEIEEEGENDLYSKM